MLPNQLVNESRRQLMSSRICQCVNARQRWSALVLMLFHGNASVESRFSVTNHILVDNLHEESLVAQRIVFYAIQTSGGIIWVEISKTLQPYVRTSRARNDDALKKKRDVSASDERKAKERQRASNQFKMLKAKNAKLTTAVVAEAKAIDTKIAELEKTVLYLY